MSASWREGGGDQHPQESVVDSEAVPPSLAEIGAVLRVADGVESDNPRVAYLCRFYAFEMAHRMDPTSCGHGVHHFKAALLHRLERENEPTLMKRMKLSDAREIQSFYRQYYEKYIQALQNAADKADGAQLSKAYQTAAVLFKVLKTVTTTQSLEIDSEVSEIHSKLEKENQYVPFNILPCETDNGNRAILQSPEGTGTSVQNLE